MSAKETDRQTDRQNYDRITNSTGNHGHRLNTSKSASVLSNSVSQQHRALKIILLISLLKTFSKCCPDFSFHFITFQLQLNKCNLNMMRHRTSQ